MNDLNIIGFDIETAGDKPEYALQAFRALDGQAWITAASFAGPSQTLGSLNPTKKHLEKMLEVVADTQAYLVGWNVAFDASWLIALGLEDVVFRMKWLDAMLLWRHLTIEPVDETTPRSKRKSYSLKAALQEFYPEAESIKDFDDFQATDEASLSKLLERNKGDAAYTRLLALKFWQQLTKEQQTAALIEARCIPLVAKTYVQGIHAGQSEAKALSKELKATAANIEAELHEKAPEAKGVNFGSPKQLQKLLYETWNLPLSRTSKKTGDPSTDKYALFDLAPLDDRAKLLKELRETKNNRTKYPEATLKSLEYNGDGCVRPQARIFGTYTSRMTYSSGQEATVEAVKHYKTKPDKIVTKKTNLPVGIALHQWKRGKEYRQMLQAPDGYMLVEFDFAGQEFRWMAVASEDETMLGLCQPGEDAHSYMGAQIAGMEYRDLIAKVRTGDDAAALSRKLGKFSNLSFQYRVSARTATMKARVDYDLEIEEHAVSQMLATYKFTFPGVTQYWNQAILKAKMAEYAETFAGRRVQLNGSWAGRDAWPMESTAINYPIQGTGADQKYLALAVLRNLLPQYGGHFYYELHDGVFVILPYSKVQQAVPHIKRELSNLPYKQAWGVDFPIKFPVDAKMGTTWGDLREV